MNLILVYGLRQEFTHTCLEASQLESFRRICCQRYNIGLICRVFKHLNNFLASVYAIFDGHINVHDYQIVILLSGFKPFPYFLDSILSVECLIDLLLIIFKYSFKGYEIENVVIYDQNTWRNSKWVGCMWFDVQS